MLCPLIKKQCVKLRCQWWLIIEGVKCCAIVSIAKDMDSLADDVYQARLDDERKD